MYATEDYNKINRVVLKILGLWPYQQSYFTSMQKLFFVSILSTLILVQVRKMLAKNQNNWKLLRDKMEFRILQNYSYIARLGAITMMGISCFGAIGFAIFQLRPLFFNIVLPLNESRSFQLICISEYFINQDKYIYAILLHHILGISVALIATLSTISTFLMFILHICALLNIASYRIENAMKENTLTISSPKRDYLLYQSIVHAIIIHRRAIKCMEFFTSEFMLSFFLLVFVGVVSLSLNLFQFLQIITLTNNIAEALIFGSLIFIHIFYMFCTNYAGQVVIDHGIMLFQASCNGMWYAAPLHMQKMLLFIIQRGSKTHCFVCGGIFTASLECFATLVNMSVSYFMVMYSSRK